MTRFSNVLSREIKAIIRSEKDESNHASVIENSFTQGLNSEQTEAVLFDHANGPLLVLAGAGAGKTTVLTKRIAWLCHKIEQDIKKNQHEFEIHSKPARILALTFTKDAALEMESRLKNLINISSVPWIGTFHGFAFSILREFTLGQSNWQRLGFSKAPVLLDEASRKEWLIQCRRNFFPEWSLDQLQHFLSGPFEKSGEKNENQIQKWGATQRESIVNLRKRYREYLINSGQIGFEDMVTLVLRLFTEHREVLGEYQGRFAFVLVDEFQDTSNDQFEFLRILMGENQNLFLVGDDDQAIYGFRGADVTNLEKAFEAFPTLKLLKLETNYRSSKAIVKYANEVFRNKPVRFRKQLVVGNKKIKDTFPVQKIIHDNGIDQCNWLVQEIQTLTQVHAVVATEIAILFRIHALDKYYRSVIKNYFGEEVMQKVIFSTVHGAKGLEFPVVFFMGLEDGILPYHRPTEILPKEKNAEERRIFYVGVTRAERFLYLCAVKKRVLHGRVIEAKPSPFLQQGYLIGPGFLDRIGGLGEKMRTRFVAKFWPKGNSSVV